ncbi:MAG: LptF/LptG family permease [Candidatus Glassbacteria bacterium]
MLRILDRYLFGEFVKILIFSILASAAISIIVDLIEKIDTYLDNRALFTDVVLYYAYHLPYIAVLTLPASTLIATIFTIGQAVRNNELTAMKASGISLYRVFTPLYVAGFLVSILAFTFGEYMVPHTNMLRDDIYKTRIVKRVKEEKGVKRGLLYKGERNTLYSIATYDIGRRSMEGVVIHRKTQTGELKYRLDAESAIWTDSLWIFKNGYLRYFGDDSGNATLRFNELVTVEMEEAPEDFQEKQREPHEMGYTELGKYIDRMERSGVDMHKDRVQRAFKVSFPFANIIIVLFGASLASTTRSSGGAVGLGLSLFIFILFWGLIHVGKALGESGVLLPNISAWLTNALFCACGFYLLVKARK